MTAVYALFEEPVAVQQAVDALRRAGVAERDIVVMSSEPFEEYEFSHIGRHSYQWYIACAGGLAGMLFSTWLTTFAEKDWPITVGNMPIVAWWPNLIVIFEMTMLGAIVTSVATLIITAGLGRKMPKLYDPEVTNGKILVGIAQPKDAAGADVERALLSAPGAQVKSV